MKKSKKRVSAGIGSRDDSGAEGGEGMDEGGDRVTMRRVVDGLDIGGEGGEGAREDRGGR